MDSLAVYEAFTNINIRDQAKFYMGKGGIQIGVRRATVVNWQARSREGE